MTTSRNPDALFGALRSALNAAPSRAAWGQVVHALTRIVSTQDEALIERALQYTRAHAARWPEHTRPFPKSWRHMLERGVPLRQLLAMDRLTLQGHYARFPMDALVGHLASSPFARNLHTLTLANGTLSWDGLNTLTSSPHLKENLGELDLRLLRLPEWAPLLCAQLPALHHLAVDERHTRALPQLDTHTPLTALTIRHARDTSLRTGLLNANTATLRGRLRALTLEAPQTPLDALADLTADPATTPALDTLWIWRAASPPPPALLHNLARRPALHALSLGTATWMHLTDAHREALTTLLASPALRTIHTLSLALHTPPEAIDALASQPHLDHLTHLRITPPAPGVWARDEHLTPSLQRLLRRPLPALRHLHLDPPPGDALRATIATNPTLAALETL